MPDTRVRAAGAHLHAALRRRRDDPARRASAARASTSSTLHGDRRLERAPRRRRSARRRDGRGRALEDALAKRRASPRSKAATAPLRARWRRRALRRLGGINAVLVAISRAAAARQRARMRARCCTSARRNCWCSARRRTRRSAKRWRPRTHARSARLREADERGAAQGVARRRGDPGRAAARRGLAAVALHALARGVWRRTRRASRKRC